MNNPFLEFQFFFWDGLVNMAPHLESLRDSIASQDVTPIGATDRTDCLPAAYWIDQ